MGIIYMHYATDTYLRKYASHSDMKANAGLMEVCRKLSKHMMYLLVTHPSILPLSISAEAALDRLQEPERASVEFSMDGTIAQLEPSKGTLEEFARIWTRLLYAAGDACSAAERRRRAHHIRLATHGPLWDRGFKY